MNFLADCLDPGSPDYPCPHTLELPHLCQQPGTPCQPPWAVSPCPSSTLSGPVLISAAPMDQVDPGFPACLWPCITIMGSLGPGLPQLPPWLPCSWAGGGGMDPGCQALADPTWVPQKPHPRGDASARGTLTLTIFQ